MSKERKEDRLERYTLETVTRLACEIALRDGYHVPTLIVEGDRGPVVGQFPELPPTHDGRREMMRAAGHALAQSAMLGSLERVFFISEAWMSVADEGEAPYMQPSRDPKRKEVLIISELKVEANRANLAIFEVVRGGEGQLVALEPVETPELDTTRAESPLLEAFVEGFRRGRRGRAN